MSSLPETENSSYKAILAALNQLITVEQTQKKSDGESRRGRIFKLVFPQWIMANS